MLIKQYFTNINSDQEDKFKKLEVIIRDINEKVNLISRNDVVNLEEHHILHSLAIAEVVELNKGKILDLGTGGGFPGLPLAIMFPDTSFYLIDSTKKKIGAVKEIVALLGLKNVEAIWTRAEDVNQKFDYVTCRAVGRLDKVWPWVKDKIEYSSPMSGLFYLKGGDVNDEIPKDVSYKRWELKDFYPGIEYFDTKSLILLQPKSYY